ncbi:hypothetical protein JI721_05415 [Alicyclobacillus cycloheptanicus]|uniref:Uncharacterized protein n=1 Tax=Alicyclobacillus cycloheptanicus TaxID=1457 RepID=A0ABT9XGI5_9BACL|nr:hypothetical protein [Alicyclobacillus cycloheptanicus]MDQ0189375.1 hypothetical protein [Alicyclobacillus cycloheptanicus]WDM02251.1 hypothetical protein JI721_05415 [Alicyclobacillus cycloheptanicus]
MKTSSSGEDNTPHEKAANEQTPREAETSPSRRNQSNGDMYTVEEIKGLPTYRRWSDMPRLDRWIQEFVGVVPQYLQGGGDHCLLLDTRGPRCYVAASVVTVTRHIAAHYGLTNLQAWHEAFLGRRLAGHIPMPDIGDALAAIKTRTPKYPNDGSRGFIAIGQIASIRAVAKGESVMRLEGSGYEIPALVSKATCQQHCNEADVFRLQLVHKELIPPPSTPRGRWDPRYI